MRAICILLIIGLSGCGTLQNLRGARYVFISGSGERPVRVYGGVRNDLEWAAEALGANISASGSDEPSGGMWKSLGREPLGVASCLPLLCFLGVVDPVFSFVGDTLTLPFVLGGLDLAGGCDDTDEAPSAED